MGKEHMGVESWRRTERIDSGNKGGKDSLFGRFRNGGGQERDFSRIQLLKEKSFESDGSRYSREITPTFPTVFAVSEIPQTDEPIRVPDLLAAVVRQEHEGESLATVPLSTMILISDALTDENGQWAIDAPFEVKARPGRIFIHDSTREEPNSSGFPLQLLRIDYDPDTREVRQVWRDAEPEAFRVTMAAFPADTVIGRISALLGKQVEPSADDIVLYQERVEEAKEAELLRDELELQSVSESNFFAGTLIETSENTNSIHRISSARYTVANSDQKDWIATSGATTCFIVSVYDRVAQRGALTHIDTTVDVAATLDNMAAETSLGAAVKQGNKENARYQVTLNGGARSFTADVVAAYRRIKGWKMMYGDNLAVEIGTVLQQSNESLALNLRTGEVRQFQALPETVEGGSGLEQMQATSRAISGTFYGKKSAIFSFSS
jgi:hypothetical protein